MHQNRKPALSQVGAALAIADEVQSVQLRATLLAGPPRTELVRLVHSQFQDASGASLFAFTDGLFMSGMFKVPRLEITNLKAKKLYLLASVASLFLSIGCALLAATPPQQCKRVVMQGEIDTGHTWSQPIGEGWVFKLLPIKASANDYSGWDMAVDRTHGVGYPDALLLATPPYGSINQREIGTTFGLRAQDAIGWNPRNFHFLTNLADMRKAQKLYFKLRNSVDSKQKNTDPKHPYAPADSNIDAAALSKSLIDIAEHSSSGQLRILDARLTPGTANALAYAQAWAQQQRSTPHTVLATTSPTPYGKLDSIKFEITLWLPANWKTPKTLQSSPSPCQ